MFAAATPMARVSEPEATPVIWDVWERDNPRNRTLTSEQHWFRAREVGAKKLGLQPHEVDAKRVKPTERKP